MRRRLSALSRIAPCLTVALVIAAFAVPASGQVVGQQVIPSRIDEPPTFFMSSYCLAVQCVGSNHYIIVKATDPDPVEAQRQAYDKAIQACPYGIEHSYPLPARACALIASDEPGPTESASGHGTKWLLKASLHYRDGSPGFKNVLFEGLTRSEAIRKARQALCCELKDPCKAAYICYCFVRTSPQQTCGCPR